MISSEQNTGEIYITKYHYITLFGQIKFVPWKMLRNEGLISLIDLSCTNIGKKCKPFISRLHLCQEYLDPSVTKISSLMDPSQNDIQCESLMVTPSQK